VTKPGVWCLKVWVHEKLDLPEAFHKCRTHEFGSLGVRGPSFPQKKKSNLGLAETQFPTV